LAFEALVRWNHPSRGSVSPERFIPLAEESGIIVSLGSWILRRACLDFKLIAGRFPSARLAVNISTRQLQEADFEFTVRRILAETNTEPSRLELEITESVLLADIKAVLPALEHLREFGVSVSLDDFGTGYSSLAYLKRLPVDTLKIDRSFVRDISDSDLDSEIAQAIVALAQSLGLRVIAEGVETELQRTYLEYLGCDELQGFLFGGPLAAPLFLNAPLRPPLRPCSVVAGEYSAPIHTSKGNPRYARRA
jgi:EAL domain-containing protein (putative c-di-GMP-specific phosphodiesterase class I)